MCSLKASPTMKTNVENQVFELSAVSLSSISPLGFCICIYLFIGWRLPDSEVWLRLDARLEIQGLSLLFLPFTHLQMVPQSLQYIFFICPFERFHWTYKCSFFQFEHFQNFSFFSVNFSTYEFCDDFGFKSFWNK